MLGVMVVPSVIFSLLLFQIPESPRWLILNGSEQAARPILERLGESNINAAIMAIRDSVKLHQESLFQRRYFKPIFFAMLLAMFNQLSGINAILYYAPRIFEMAGFDKSQSFSRPIFVGAANLFFTLLAMTVIDKFGRKKLLIIGSLGMILFLGLTARAFHDIGSGSSHLLLYLIGFIAFFAFSQGAVIWVFISEIFPNAVRSQGGSLGSSTHWIMAWIITTVFPFVTEGHQYGAQKILLYFFSVMMFIQLIFVWRVMRLKQRAVRSRKYKKTTELSKDLAFIIKVFIIEV